MALLDTLDSALMLALYTRTPRAHDPLATLYSSIVLTALTVLVALVIGCFQLLLLILTVAAPRGRFWEGVESVGRRYDVVGGVICVAFVGGGVVGAVGFGAWRRWVERRQGGGGDGDGGGDEGGVGGVGMESVRVEGADKV